MRFVTPDEQKRLRETAEPKRKPRRYVSQGGIIALACDHYTTTGTQEAYSAWRTAPDLYMCEICGIEVSGRQIKEMPPQPDEPPF